MSELNIDIDCIEIDKNLQSILRGKNFKVICDDFLTLSTYKKYDLILINPPFENGDKHLLKAIEMQKDGGIIICLLNAETIKNPYSQNRKTLIELLNKYNAKIDFIENVFINSEHKTDAETAIIYIDFPEIEYESDIYNKMNKKYGSNIEFEEETNIVVNDYLQAIVSQYDVEVASTIELIKTYISLRPHILRTINHKNGYTELPLIGLIINGQETHNIAYDKLNKATNDYLKAVRHKYWTHLLSNPKFTSKLTYNLQQKYRKMVNKLQDYDFSMYNIENLMIEMNAEIHIGIKETILNKFDKITTEHSYYQECNKNKYLFTAWKTNKAHKINKKVIIPCYGLFEDKAWRGTFKF